MKNRRKMKSILCLMLAAVFVFSCLSVSTSAYTTTTTGEYDISPSKSEFQSAKNPKYYNIPTNISDSISQPYELDIYHFEAPCTGYFAIYTTGSLDTIGAVYEENGALFWTHYDQVAYSDDTNYSPYYRNCLMVVKMKQFEDYYICVRAYASKTGNYTLVIEPNQDKKTSYNGGVWTSQENIGPDDKTIRQKVYLTKSQALLNYLWLIDVDFETDEQTTLDFEYISETYDEDRAEALSLTNTFMSIAASFVPSPYSVPFSITITLLGAVIDCVYEQTTQDLREMLDIFKNECGIVPRLVSLDGMGAIVLYPVEHGLLRITRSSDNSNWCTYTYNQCDDTLVTGAWYCLGSWN